MYKLKKFSMSSELAKKTNCKLASLKKIMRKGLMYIKSYSWGFENA
jgi:hypothetical protein